MVTPFFMFSNNLQPVQDPEKTFLKRYLSVVTVNVERKAKMMFHFILEVVATQYRVLEICNSLKMA